MSDFLSTLRSFIAGDVHGIVARIEDKNGRIVGEGAAGIARVGGPAISTDSVFHVASVGKTFTAVLVLQLVEERLLSLSMPLSATEVFDDEVIYRLHRRNGVNCGHQITLRHLLSHGSGIRDAIVDGVSEIGTAPPDSFVGRLMRPHGNPGRYWRPWDDQRPDDRDAGVLNYFLNSGLSEAALFEPGEGFHYSDTGYVILGLVLEHVTQKPLHQLYRERIFLPLEMGRSYLAYRDDPVNIGADRQPECEVWVGQLPVFSSGVSLSFDWAGGGIVSTAAELIRFHRALMRGDLYRSRATLDAMLAWQAPKGLAMPRTGVGLGLFCTQYSSRLLVGHSGHWGVRMQMDPREGIYIAGTLNQSHGPADWHVKLLDSLKWERK